MKRQEVPIQKTDPALERATKHVKNVRDFFYHLMVFVFVNGLLAILDRGAGANDGVFGLDWAYWPLLFWGLGLVGHAIWVFLGDHQIQRVYQKEKSREGR